MQVYRLVDPPGAVKRRNIVGAKSRLVLHTEEGASIKVHTPESIFKITAKPKGFSDYITGTIKSRAN